MIMIECQLNQVISLFLGKPLPCPIFNSERYHGILQTEFEPNIFILGKEKSIFGDEAFKRIRFGLVIQMTSIGIPMIWMGEEIGE